jgi:predicted dehydrogenase
MKKVAWGILGTGKIAHTFAEDLTAMGEADLVAVGSRAAATAERFGQEFDVPRRHDSYAALAQDPQVDVIYVATPHPFHKENTLLCLQNGKAVLCEKPLAMNSAEVREMIACARENNVFLMEGMWTHCYPAMIELAKLLQEGAIGEVRLVEAKLCGRVEWDPQRRAYNPHLGGGALLDLGVYTISFAHKVYGKEPTSITSSVRLGETGVDEYASMLFEYEDGAMATLTVSLRFAAENAAVVYGTEGWIRVPPNFIRPDEIQLVRGGRSETMAFERLGNGFIFEAQEVMSCLRQGLLESPIVPWDQSLAVMRTMDALRSDWALTYPMEA